MTTDEFGHDLEHVEVLQRKFDEFQKDMASQEYRVTEVNELADKLVLDGHPERDIILKRKEVFIMPTYKQTLIPLSDRAERKSTVVCQIEAKN